MINIGARVVCHAFVSEGDAAALTGGCLLMANRWWHRIGL